MQNIKTQISRERETTVFYSGHLFGLPMEMMVSGIMEYADDISSVGSIGAILPCLHLLFGVPVGVIHDGHQSQPSLLGGGHDLIGWQDETIAASVPQLKRVGVLDALVVGPVDGSTAGLVCE